VIEIEQKINNTVLDLSMVTSVESNSSLRDDLGFDSLRMVELMVELEEEFNIEFDESDLDPQMLNKVSDLYNLLGRYA
jgi:acyl carrier protein